MKISSYFMTAALAVVAILASSCEEDSDTTKPTISVVEPEEELQVVAGSEIHFEADFADDTELKSYKIDIHSNKDGHSHKSEKKSTVDWTFQKSWNFEAGKKNQHIHHHEVVVPASINGVAITLGEYHFLVYCTDAAGNESWIAIPVDISLPLNK